ncbi:MAG: cation:proton antiporter [Leptospira sp.]|nr:cation:proton antiporter [Leptospira sp.]
MKPFKLSMPTFQWTLPIQEPVSIFACILLIFLLVPIILRQIKLPSIMGLILMGVAFGPHGLQILERSQSIILFGTVGLLYIAFVAGLEVDLNDFKNNRKKSVLFGIMSFSIPFIIGIFVVRYFLEYEWTTSILLASTFGSHTLLSYPIVSRLGITKNESVNITIGGSILTDFFALLILAIISSSTQGDLNVLFWGKLSGSLILFMIIVLYFLPRVAKWFFTNLEAEGTSQFTFVLAMVFSSAFLAKQAGLEPILGSFLAGLALNKFILHTSTLMNRIDFVGKALFIPFFLIGVGMLVDPKLVVGSSQTIIVGTVMISCVLVGKYVAAQLITWMFGYSKYEKMMIFSLSVAQAAATLAAVLVGYNLGILNEDVLNGTILMILVTCLISSILTESYGKKLAIEIRESDETIAEVSKRILVPIANPDTIESLIDLSFILNHSVNSDSYENPVYPLVVVRDEEGAEERIRKSHELLQQAVSHAQASENNVQIVTRIDWNIGHGIVRAATELMITHILMGWNGKITAKDRVFGSVLDNVMESSDQLILVTRILSPLNTIKSILLYVPENAEIETGFPRWAETVLGLANQINATLEIHLHEGSRKAIETFFPPKGRINVQYEEIGSWSQFSSLSWKLNREKLFVIISARKGAISHDFHMDSIPHLLSHDFQSSNFVIVYPER